MSNPIVCVNCFRNEGIRILVTKFGKTYKNPCINCGNVGLPQLDKDSLKQLFDDFFISGTVSLGVGGIVPILKETSNKEMESVHFEENLEGDYKLISSKLGIYAFHYSTPLWKFGITDQYKCLEPPNGDIDYFEEILSKCGICTLKAGTIIYRIRLNPNDLLQPANYDTPPRNIKHEYNRFDEKGLPIFYSASDIETCLHECRILLEDQIALASFKVTNDLNIIDLVSGFNESIPRDPFKSLTMLFNAISLGGEWVYPRARVWSRFLYSKGIPGFRYTSYYSQVKSTPHSNIALFGYPLKEGLIKLKSLNNIRLQEINYKYTFGPIKT